MELAIMKREIIGDSAQVETESVAKYEIMDGAPVKGESIPIRLFLGGYDLTPTMRDVQKKFSCKYYLNLVLVDEEVTTRNFNFAKMKNHIHFLMKRTDAISSSRR